jgi:hypothetical protein
MDAYLCSSCDAPTPQDDHIACQSCEAKWCYDCENSGRVRQFHYSSDEKAPTLCDLCFPTKPLRVRDADLLDYALQRLQTSKKRLREQVLEDGPIQFRVAPNVLQCRVHTEGACASTECHMVSCSQISTDGEVWYGLCCYEGHPTSLGLCVGCRRWEARPAIVTLLGIRKFRKNTILATSVPRDVLVHCIIKPYFWPLE